MSTCLTRHGVRLDFDSETFITHSLRGEGFDASEDGTGRGTPLVPVAFAATDYESGAFDQVEQAAPLTTSADRTRAAPILAFSAKDHGADCQEDLSPTLRAGGHSGSHANAGVMPAIAFGPQDSIERQAEGFRALRAWSLMPQNSGRDFKARAVDVAQPLMVGGPVGGNQGGDYIQSAMQVRRLTPVECARLQGFPDHYLDITYRGKPAADGPKYKALGNSWAVPCARWIGQRINAIRAVA